MKINKQLTRILIVCLSTVFSIETYANSRDLLSRGYPLEVVEQLTANSPTLTIFPKISERDRWQALPKSIKTALVERGEKGLNFRYNGLKASQYFADTKAGSYRNSRNTQILARRHLVNMVLAEGVENKGRFLPAIVDLIWSISEESSWPSLSHFYLHKEGDEAKLTLALPDVTDPVVDLWGATTGKNLAWIYLILGEKFDQMSPRINARIKHEVKRRILTPSFQRDDFWWQGFSAGNGGIVNNWNPWIASNWLPALLILEDGPDKAKAIHKLLRVVDQFINSYSLEGGIDEGPSYWNRAAGSLFDVLHILHIWSDGAIDIFEQPKIRNMLQYIYRAHIHDEYVVNFTDAPPTLSPNINLLNRISTLLDDSKMRQFAVMFAKEQEGLAESSHKVETSVSTPDIDREMFSIFYPAKKPKGELNQPYQLTAWYPGVEHMMTRSFDGRKEGFFVAAKGGHNNESHNHNDVGSFMVYYQGLPVFIDVGVRGYTLKTFGADRYSNWNMQSAYHNLPTINGVMQPFGPQYKASGVSYQHDISKTSMSMNLASAYPVKAGVESWQREISLVRGNSNSGLDHQVVLSEQVELNTSSGETTLNFITPNYAEVIGDQVIVDLPQHRIALNFDQNLFEAKAETFPVDDEVIERNWQVKSMTRIVFKLKQRIKQEAWQFTISPTK